MKVVHKRTVGSGDREETFDHGMRLEKERAFEDAAKVYEKLLGLRPHDEKIYDRLMIVYRKLNDPKKELGVIKKGIASFESIHQSVRRPVISKKVMQLSKALLRATGLADKRGKPLFDREPVARWKKRKALVEKKYLKQKKNKAGDE
jgi:hypothetical protein